MQPGDRVLFVAELDAEPLPGTVVRCYGTFWVDIDLDSGNCVEGVRAASSTHLSPRGHYCVMAQLGSERPESVNR